MRRSRVWLLALLAVVACGHAAGGPRTAPATPLPSPEPGTYLYASDFGGDVSIMLPGPSWERAGSVLSADGRRSYTIDRQGLKPMLLARDLPAMALAHREEIAFRWGLPTVSGDSRQGERGGLSPDGRWLVLDGGLDTGTSTGSRFLVYDTAFARAPREVLIAGRFDFDAISNDGIHLFLIEHTAQNRYFVRLYDLARGRLLPDNLVDKSAPAELMRGNRTDSVASPSGEWLFSAYADSGKSFIHALGIGKSTPYAWCIDLPRTNASNWRLALGKDRLYAFSTYDGLLAELSLTEPPRVLRTMTLPRGTAAWNPFGVDAQAKEVLGAGARPAISADGKSVYLVTDQAVWSVDAQSLTVRARWLEGRHPWSVVVDPDGWLYATTTSAAGVLRLDPRTGEVADRLSASPGLTLLRVQVFG